MNSIKKLPKKILRISDLTFTLPDNFEGDIISAIDVMLDYMKTKPEFQLLDNDQKSTVESLFEHLKNTDEPKICMQYGIFECDDNGNYILK